MQGRGVGRSRICMISRLHPSRRNMYVTSHRSSFHELWLTNPLSTGRGNRQLVFCILASQEIRRKRGTGHPNPFHHARHPRRLWFSFHPWLQYSMQLYLLIQPAITNHLFPDSRNNNRGAPQHHAEPQSLQQSQSPTRQSGWN